MGKKKRYRGHYCKICGSIKSNEKFSGKGHKNHICKTCSKLPADKKRELMLKSNEDMIMIDPIELLLENTEFINETYEEYDFNFIDNDDDELPF